MSKTKDNTSCAQPGYVKHDVVHCRQHHSWDCGVTCVMMLLSEDHRQNLLENFDKICQEDGFGQSTWTIDLCYLLQRYGVASCLYTITLGVNHHHRAKKFYNKIYDKDYERVLRRFDEAPARNIVCVQQALSIWELEGLVLRGPVILLVDSGLLYCNLCKHNKMNVEFRRWFGGSYRGHYIVVVGAHHTTRRFLYHDPAAPPHLCSASYAAVDRARRSPGTDQDLISLHGLQT